MTTPPPQAISRGFWGNKLDKHEKKLNTARLLTVIAFCAALGVIFLLLMVLPKHAGELSPLEFRALQEYPWKSSGQQKSAQTIAEDIVKGDFSANTDKFLEDHFPARKFFIALNAYTLRWTGRNADQAVVKGKNGRLYDAVVRVDETRLAENVSKLNEFAEANGLRLTYVNVPTSAVTVQEDLPALSLEYHDAEAAGYIAEHVNGFVPDLISLYKAQPEPAKLMYRTDHHWTMEGAYLCYADIARELDLEPVPASDFTVEKYDFYGSYYRKAGLWSTPPDTLEVWRTPALDNAKVTIGYGAASVTHTGVYDSEKLLPGEVDRYAAYLYSNNAVTIIENPEGNGGSVMIVKDSFGNSIAPLFSATYSTVVMLDTRYFRGIEPAPSELVNEYGIKDIIVVLGTDSSVSNIQIGFMR